MKRSRLTDALKRRLFPRRKNTRRPRRESRALPQAAEQLEVRTLLSAVAVRVDEINAAGAENPNEFVEVNGSLYFTANDGTNGQELWKFDGTTASQVADIHPGVGSSDPQNLTNVNGTLFFTADDGSNGRELWTFDGTSATQVADINPGAVSSDPDALTEVNGTLFFAATNPDNGGRELWKSDGNSAELVADIRPGNDVYSSFPHHLTNVNGTLFFVATDPGNGGREMWKYDGTSATRVTDIVPGSDSSFPRYLENVNGTLFFSANDGANGFELWQYDGTSATQVEDINPGPASSIPFQLTNLNGTLVFSATKSGSGEELWQYDGTDVTPLPEIGPGISSSKPRELINVDGTLFFAATNFSNGRELWQSDGTTVTLVDDVRPGSGSSNPENLTEFNGTLFFTATDGVNGTEVWKLVENAAPTAVTLQNTTPTLSEDTDTTAAPIKVAEIVVTDDGVGTNSLSLAGDDAAHFTIVNNELYLKANTPLDFETKSTYTVTVRVDDPRVGSTPDASTDFTLTLTDVNEAPTAIALQNTTPTLAENTDTTTRIKVAEIDVTDDALGTNTLSLTGPDAAFFEIDGTELFLKANTTLDFEAKSTYDITVQVDDASVGNTPDATTDFTLTVTDVNEAPTAVTLQNVVDTIEENTDTSDPIKVADILVTDDVLGINTLSLSGADAESFEIIGSELFLKAGVTLDFESQTSYDVTVEVTDNALGGGPHATAHFTLNVTDVDERPPLVRFVWTIFGWQMQTVRRSVGWFFGW